MRAKVYYDSCMKYYLICIQLRMSRRYQAHLTDYITTPIEKSTRVVIEHCTKVKHYCQCCVNSTHIVLVYTGSNRSHVETARSLLAAHWS